MVRTLQSDVGKINEFAVYTPSTLKFPCMFIEKRLLINALLILNCDLFVGQSIIPLAANQRAKQIIEKYRLRQSMLIFQLVFVDQDNVAYLTDCRCQTEPIQEYEGEFWLARRMHEER